MEEGRGEKGARDKVTKRGRGKEGVEGEGGLCLADQGPQVSSYATADGAGLPTLPGPVSRASPTLVQGIAWLRVGRIRRSSGQSGARYTARCTSCRLSAGVLGPDVQRRRMHTHIPQFFVGRGGSAPTGLEPAVSVRRRLGRSTTTNLRSTVRRRGGVTSAGRHCGFRPRRDRHIVRPARPRGIPVVGQQHRQWRQHG